MKQKISRRFGAVLIAVALLPVGVMGYQAYRAAQSALLRTAFLHMETIARDHAHHLEQWFQERSEDIRMLSELPSIRSMCSRLCRREGCRLPHKDMSRSIRDIIVLTQVKSPSYESIHIMTPQGGVIASTNPDSQDALQFTELGVFEKLRRAMEPVLGRVHQHGDGLWSMHLAAPIRAEENRVAAFVLAVLDVSKTLDPLMDDRIGLGETGETYLVSSQGRMITRLKYVSRKEAYGRRFDSHGIDAALNQGSGTGVYTSYAGKEVVGAYLWLKRFDWALLAEMNRAEIMKPLKSIKTAVVVTAGVVIALGLFFALAMSRRVAAPIVRVAHAAREISQGRLEQRIDCSRHDEVGLLAESFNVMTRKLSTLIGSLQQKEESLRAAYDELMATQQQLVRSERMAAIGELVTSVVHEMRTPLSSVKLNLQIIGRSLEEDNPLSEHHRLALDQVLQMERMLSDLLNYSKPLTLDRTSVDLGELLEKTLVQLENEAADRQTQLETDWPRELPPVYGDPDRIQQALVNIVKNAMEASGSAGRVNITAEAMEEGGRHFLRVTVADSGPGVPIKHKERIFKPFFTTKQKGTGLGLCIVRKIMEAHGGSVAFEENRKTGSVFELRFPLS